MEYLDVNMTDKHGRYGLFEAAVHGDEDLCDILLSHPEVDVNKMNCFKMT